VSKILYSYSERQCPCFVVKTVLVLYELYWFNNISPPVGQQLDQTSTPWKTCGRVPPTTNHSHRLPPTSSTLCWWARSRGHCVELASVPTCLIQRRSQVESVRQQLFVCRRLAAKVACSLRRAIPCWHRGSSGSVLEVAQRQQCGQQGATWKRWSANSGWSRSTSKMPSRRNAETSSWRQWVNFLIASSPWRRSHWYCHCSLNMAGAYIKSSTVGTVLKGSENLGRRHLPGASRSSDEWPAPLCSVSVSVARSQLMIRHEWTHAGLRVAKPPLAKRLALRHVSEWEAANDGRAPSRMISKQQQWRREAGVDPGTGVLVITGQLKMAWKWSDRFI